MKITDILLAVLIAFLWGFNFVVIEIGLESFPPILFSSLRFLCSAFPAVLILNRGGIEWKWIVSIGVTLGIVMFSLLFIGMNIGMPAGLSSLVLQIQAVFTLILTGIILRDMPTSWQKFGMFIAFCGIGFLVFEKYETTSFWGLVLVIAAGFAWAVSNILMKKCGKIDMLRLIVWMSIVPPIPLFLISLIFENGQYEAIKNISLTGIGAVLYAGYISTVVAFAIWGKLFQKYSPNTVAPFSLLVPIFGIFSSIIVLNETLIFFELIASCLVFSGLIFIVFGEKISGILFKSNLRNK